MLQYIIIIYKKFTFQKEEKDEKQQKYQAK